MELVIEKGTAGKKEKKKPWAANFALSQVKDSNESQASAKLSGEKASNKGDSTAMSVLSRGSDPQMGREVEKKQLQTGEG